MGEGAKAPLAPPGYATAYLISTCHTAVPQAGVLRPIIINVFIYYLYL